MTTGACCYAGNLPTPPPTLSFVVAGASPTPVGIWRVNMSAGEAASLFGSDDPGRPGRGEVKVKVQGAARHRRQNRNAKGTAAARTAQETFASWT